MIVYLFVLFSSGWKFCCSWKPLVLIISESKMLRGLCSEGFSSCRWCTFHSWRLVRFKNVTMLMRKFPVLETSCNMNANLKSFWYSSSLYLSLVLTFSFYFHNKLQEIWDVPFTFFHDFCSLLYQGCIHKVYFLVITKGGRAD